MAKILIAEDEVDIRELIRLTLLYHGHEVLAASNGEQAVALAREKEPDLILLDVRMPRMDGYEACRLIKAEPSLQSIPVAFLSAKGQTDEIDAGLKAGGSDYIVKPFSPEELITRVQAILASNGG